MSLPDQNSLPWYTIENTGIVDELKAKYPDKTITYTQYERYFIIYIDGDNGCSINVNYHSIYFYDMPQDIIDFVVDHTGCKYYIIYVNSRITKIVTPEYNNDIYVIPSSYNSYGIYYDIYSVDYSYAGLFYRNNTLILLRWMKNINTLTSTLININETVTFSEDDYYPYYDEIKQLFDKNRLWIPPKRNSPCFRPQFLD